MMKSQLDNMLLKGLMLAIVFVVSISMVAHADEDGYALLIQSSPPDGGTVTPGLGVLRTAMNETVTLAAKPKEGYRFMYWLGDVSSTGAVDTTVLTDSPKLVVAVFAREDFDEELSNTNLSAVGTPVGGGGGRYVNPIQSPGSVSPVVHVEYPDYRYPYSGPDNPDTDQPGDDDIPVPGGDDDDIPVPGDGEVPEPATILLLGMGASVLLRQRK